MFRGSRGGSRRRKTWRWRSGSGSSRSCPRGCCGQCGCGRPIRTGLRSVTKAEAPVRAGRELRRRYTAADLRVFTRDEVNRFVPHGDGDPRTDIVLAWELLYRLEPELYDRLASAERLHPGVLGWLPRTADRIAEVGAGTGRLTLELIDRGREVVAVEPARPLRHILRRKLAAADHGGEAGLAEMERVCRPGGCVAIIWPNHLDWLAARGYRYVCFPGTMSVEFGSHKEAVELAGIFYPGAAEQVRRRGLRRVPFEVLGINPPRDLAFKVLGR